MEEKEVEQKLQESADNIELRDFSKVWESIKDRVEAPVKKRRTPRWVPALVSVACGVVICAVAVPLALSGGEATVKPPEKTYFHDELLLVSVSPDEFYTGLSGTKIPHVDFSRYVLTGTYLYKTEKGTVKGGYLDITDDISNSTFYLMLKFYEKDVQVKDYEDVIYEYQYSVNGAQIEYKLKESYPDMSIYTYDIKAVHQTTQYFMEYTCSTENITPFLDSFFE